MRWLVRLVIAAASFSLTPVVAAAGTTGAVHGIVRDLFSERPLSGVSIMMCDGTGQVRTSTDVRGFYTFISLLPGPHRVELMKDGFTSSEEDGIVVLADQVITVNLFLLPPGSMFDPVGQREPSVVNSDVSDSVWAFGADGHPSYMRPSQPVSCGFLGRGGQR
jgi:hypothetical protein